MSLRHCASSSLSTIGNVFFSLDEFFPRGGFLGLFMLMLHGKNPKKRLSSPLFRENKLIIASSWQYRERKGPERRKYTALKNVVYRLSVSDICACSSLHRSIPLLFLDHLSVSSVPLCSLYSRGAVCHTLARPQPPGALRSPSDGLW